MPTPLSVSNATLKDLAVGANDQIKLALLFEKVPGNATQVVDLAAFAALYSTTDDKVSAAIRNLEAAKALAANYGTVTLNWITTPVISATEAQLQNDWNSRILDDPTYYVYSALALTKTGAAIQTVDPAFFNAPPWNISTPILISEIQKLAARKPTTANPLLIAPFTADFATVTLTWLSANLGNAA